MFEATQAITGEPVLARHVNANLTLCDLPSQSIVGPSVDVSFALSSFIPKPLPVRYEVDKLFHELLTDYLEGHPIRHSALLPGSLRAFGTTFTYWLCRRPSC